MLITFEISNIWDRHCSRNWKGLPSNQPSIVRSRRHRISMAEIHQQTSHSKNIDIFRFTRFHFGVISSQSILAATIVYHLRAKKGPIAKKLMKDLYVDNLITSTNSKDTELKYMDKENKYLRKCQWT